MRRTTILVAGALLAGGLAWAQELLVFPAVTDEEPGLNDSLWVTVARVVKVNAGDPVTLRRKWVCLPGGGFLDDPATAPVWPLNSDWFMDRLALLWGDELLVGATTSVGAVALEVEGGEVLAHAYVVDTNRGLHDPGYAAFGQGQLTPAFREPLRGSSHIPWLGGCLNRPCAQDPPATWDYLRNNIGIVNPNAEPLTVRGTIIPFAYVIDFGGYGEVPDDPPEAFEKVVPPYGWLQFRWAATHDYQSPFLDFLDPTPGFVISLTPEPDLPYYAYASVVFTPDPGSGVPLFSDPMYVPAEPGYVAPWAESLPPR